MSTGWPDIERDAFPVIAPPPPEVPGLSVGRVVLLMLIFMGLQLGMGLIIGVVGAATKLTYFENPLVIGVINVISCMVVLFIGVVWSKMRAAAAIPFAPVPILLFLPLTLSILGMSILLSEASNYLAWILPPPHFVNQIF